MKKVLFGFTLIETLVAVSVLLMALLGPLEIAAQSLRSAYYSRDQITAYYLAQEGIEYVRAVRDENYLNNQDWLTNLTDCDSVMCTVDMPNFSHAVCPNGVCPVLLKTDAGGLFNQNSGSAAIFTRSVILRPVSGITDERIITVTVSWRSAGIQRTFSLSERIFNWL